jgi:probable HAF family extracellular repeat protein
VVGATFCGIYEYGYLVKNGKLTDVDYPGAEQSDPFGINDSDEIVGYYNPASAYFYSFVSMRGKYISFSYPGAVETFAYAINNGGQIVGSYSLDYQTYHGFVTNPIVPGDFGFDGCCAEASSITK